MKTATPISLILLALGMSFFAQAQTKIYYDQYWNETTRDKAFSYRIITQPAPPDTLIRILDFYMSGQPLMDGAVTTLKYYDNYVGRVNWYFPNGQLKKYITYSPETLKADGPAAWYLPNGELLAKGTYQNGSAYDGILRNHTYAARFSNVSKGKLISRISYWKDSHQIAHEVFYRPDLFQIDKEVYYDKKGQIIGTLIYAQGSGFLPESGTKVDFYQSEYRITGVKRVLEYKDKEADGLQITYNPDGTVKARGTNKKGHHFDGTFIDGQTHLVAKNGLLISSTHYSKKGTIQATLTYRNGQIWEGTDWFVIVNENYKNGQKTERIEYFTPEKKQIKSLLTFSDSSIKWYDKSGRFLGMGTYKDGYIWDGLNVNYNLNTTLYTHYKDGIKEGVEQLLDEDDKLLSEKIYQADLIMSDKTLSPLTGKMVACEYRDGMAYNGHFFEYNEESFFKNGLLLQQNTYTEKDGKLTLSESIFFDPNNEYYKTKKIIYEEGREYILTYKDNRPFNGEMKEGITFQTFKEGKKTGPYRLYKDGQIVESGNYNDGQRDGKIVFNSIVENKTFSCTFKNGNPIDGIKISDSWGSYERIPYKDGKRHGERVSKYHGTLTENYINGERDGQTTYTTQEGLTYTGFYKKDKPFNGDFYDTDLNYPYAYINGKKEGTFKHRFNYWIATEKYKNDIITWQRMDYANGGTILCEAIFKQGLPYQGVVLTEIDATLFQLSPYENGQKNGVEKLLHFTYGEQNYVGTKTYRNGLADGSVHFSAKDYLPKGIAKTEGIYKDNKPFSGTFLTNYELKNISTYKGGQKDGIEIVQTRETQDTIIYQNGLPIDGIQIEFYPNDDVEYFRHEFKYGKRIQSTITHSNARFTITYHKDGFKVTNRNDDFDFIFKNAKQTKGRVDLYSEGQPIGSLSFNNGIFTRGDINVHGLHAYAKGKTFIFSFEEHGIITTISTPYTLPAPISYLDFNIFEQLFFDATVQIHATQKLSNGTFLCSYTKDTGLKIQIDKDNLYKIYKITGGAPELIEKSIQYEDLSTRIREHTKQ